MQEDQILTMLLLHCLSLTAMLAMMRGVDCEAQAASRSSLHYNFDHSYGYQDHHNPYLGYKHQHGHHYNDIGEQDYPRYRDQKWSDDQNDIIKFTIMT